MAYQPRQYIATALWHRTSGSYQYYIDMMQEKASKQGAPLDALYERDGQWTCVSDLKPDHPFRAAYIRELESWLVAAWPESPSLRGPCRNQLQLNPEFLGAAPAKAGEDY